MKQFSTGPNWRCAGVSLSIEHSLRHFTLKTFSILHHWRQFTLESFIQDVAVLKCTPFQGINRRIILNCIGPTFWKLFTVESFPQAHHKRLFTIELLYSAHSWRQFTVDLFLTALFKTVYNRATLNCTAFRQFTVESFSTAQPLRQYTVEPFSTAKCLRQFTVEPLSTAHSWDSLYWCHSKLHTLEDSLQWNRFLEIV